MCGCFQQSEDFTSAHRLCKVLRLNPLLSLGIVASILTGVTATATTSQASDVLSAQEAIKLIPTTIVNVEEDFKHDYILTTVIKQPEVLESIENIELLERQEASAPAAEASPAAPQYTGGGSKEEWLAASGIPQSDWGYVDFIVNRESGWNPNATNASSGACGLAQALPCSKIGGAGGYDPVTALQWQHSYVTNRYGGYAQAYDFWSKNHWY